jgi:hypothetical protein
VRAFSLASHCPAFEIVLLSEAHGPESVEWASPHCNIIHIVPLNPAYPAFGGTGHVPVKTFIVNFGLVSGMALASPNNAGSGFIGFLN